MKTKLQHITASTATGAVFALLAIALCSGCGRRHAPPEQRTPPLSQSQINRHIVNAHFDEQADAGALASRTLHSHHFHRNLATLNDLGERRIGALAANIDGSPLKIHVAGENIDDGLYDARVAAVRERLALAGIDEVEFLQNPPTPAMMSSDRVIRALQNERRAAPADQTAADRNATTGSSTR